MCGDDTTLKSEVSNQNPPAGNPNFWRCPLQSSGRVLMIRDPIPVRAAFIIIALALSCGCGPLRTQKTETHSPEPISKAAVPQTNSAAAAKPAASVSDSFPVAIRVDAARSMGPLRKTWRFFGADEPNYATMKDGQKLLTELGKLRPQEVYFRTHNLLTSGDGTPALKWGSSDAYREDADGKPIYSWTILDRIFDSYLTR